METKLDAFSGSFTPSLRSQLHHKRVQLGLSYAQLGRILNFEWSTIRNWENGRTGHCNPSSTQRIRRFLAGEYDGVTPQSEGRPGELSLERSLREMPPALQQCAERLVDACRICAEHEGLRNQLVLDIDHSISGVIRQLLD